VGAGGDPDPTAEDPGQVDAHHETDPVGDGAAVHRRRPRPTDVCASSTTPVPAVLHRDGSGQGPEVRERRCLPVGDQDPRPGDGRERNAQDQRRHAQRDAGGRAGLPAA
jgi:hypothetical protein